MRFRLRSSLLPCLLCLAPVKATTKKAQAKRAHPGCTRLKLSPKREERACPRRREGGMFPLRGGAGPPFRNARGVCGRGWAGPGPDSGKPTKSTKSKKKKTAKLNVSITKSRKIKVYISLLISYLRSFNFGKGLYSQLYR